MVGSQTGSAAGQSELDAHCTHFFEVALQIGAPVGQSSLRAQLLVHFPAATSHVGFGGAH